jgi:ATP synthase protein I
MSDQQKPPSLDDVGARLKAAQDRVADKKTAERGKQAASQDAGVGFRIGVELVAGVLFGAGLGWFIDSKLDTKPIFMLACIALGFAASVLSVIRVLKNLDHSVGLGRAMREKETGQKADLTPPKPPMGFEDEDE